MPGSWACLVSSDDTEQTAGGRRNHKKSRDVAANAQTASIGNTDSLTKYDNDNNDINYTQLSRLVA